MHELGRLAITINTHCGKLSRAREKLYTRYSGDKATGHIDHILTYGALTTTAYGTTNQYFWRLCSDHRPLWAQYEFKHINNQRIPIHRLKSTTSTKMDPRDERLSKTYTDMFNTHSQLNINIDALTTTQKDLLLEQICLLSVNIVESHNVKHKKSKKKRWMVATILTTLPTTTRVHRNQKKNARNLQATHVDCIQHVRSILATSYEMEKRC